MNDVLVIGGGHNGLAAATFLAKAGFKTLVLERGDRVGGAARTSEIAPGFRCSTLAHAASIDPAIARALALERHGLQIIRPDVDVCAIGGARPLTLWHDTARAASEVAAHSADDAIRYPKFIDAFGRISRVLRSVLAAIPPSIDDPSGRRFDRVAENRASLSQSRQSGRLSLVAMGANGGGRFRSRMVPGRIAPRCPGRRRHPRIVSGPVERR
jgi:phytoene dehydrogenase-like protein